MIRKFLSSLGIGAAAGNAEAATGTAGSAVFHAPYADASANFLYNLLFCDDPQRFRRPDGTDAGGPWTALLAPTPDVAALRAIAADENAEGRVRALACHRLRDAGESVPAKQLFGVIVEVPLAQGLDVLAAFTDGGVRYLNQSGRIAVFEGSGHPVEDLAKALVRAGQPVVQQIGPWDKPRLPPPKAGGVRLSFLVSDGLYFGEGPFAVFQQDRMAGPVLAAATQLLQRVVAIGTTPRA